MPFINTKTTLQITEAQELLLKEKMGTAIRHIGKSESWLMLNFDDNCRMYFKGDNKESMAMIEIALFGNASDSQYDALTEELTKEVSAILNIKPENIYIKYEGTANFP